MPLSPELQSALAGGSPRTDASLPAANERPVDSLRRMLASAPAAQPQDENARLQSLYESDMAMAQMGAKPRNAEGKERVWTQDAKGNLSYAEIGEDERLGAGGAFGMNAIHNVGKGAGMALGGLAGAKTLGAAGAALGTAIMPGPGTAVGAAAGSIIGGIGGMLLGGWGGQKTQDFAEAGWYRADPEAKKKRDALLQLAREDHAVTSWLGETAPELASFLVPLGPSVNGTRIAGSISKATGKAAFAAAKGAAATEQTVQAAAMGAAKEAVSKYAGRKIRSAAVQAARKEVGKSLAGKAARDAIKEAATRIAAERTERLAAEVASTATASAMRTGAKAGQVVRDIQGVIAPEFASHIGYTVGGKLRWGKKGYDEAVAQSAKANSRMMNIRARLFRNAERLDQLAGLSGEELKIAEARLLPQGVTRAGLEARVAADKRAYAAAEKLAAKATRALRGNLFTSTANSAANFAAFNAGGAGAAAAERGDGLLDRDLWTSGLASAGRGVLDGIALGMVGSGVERVGGRIAESAFGRGVMEKLSSSPVFNLLDAANQRRAKAWIKPATGYLWGVLGAAPEGAVASLMGHMVAESAQAVGITDQEPELRWDDMWHTMAQFAFYKMLFGIPTAVWQYKAGKNEAEARHQQWLDYKGIREREGAPVATEENYWKAQDHAEYIEEMGRLFDKDTKKQLQEDVRQSARALADVNRAINDGKVEDPRERAILDFVRRATDAYPEGATVAEVRKTMEKWHFPEADIQNVGGLGKNRYAGMRDGPEAFRPYRNAIPRVEAAKAKALDEIARRVGKPEDAGILVDTGEGTYLCYGIGANGFADGQEVSAETAEKLVRRGNEREDVRVVRMVSPATEAGTVDWNRPAKEAPKPEAEAPKPETPPAQPVAEPTPQPEAPPPPPAPEPQPAEAPKEPSAPRTPPQPKPVPADRSEALRQVTRMTQKERVRLAAETDSPVQMHALLDHAFNGYAGRLVRNPNATPDVLLRILRKGDARLDPELARRLTLTAYARLTRGRPNASGEIYRNVTANDLRPLLEPLRAKYRSPAVEQILSDIDRARIPSNAIEEVKEAVRKPVVRLPTSETAPETPKEPEAAPEPAPPPPPAEPAPQPEPEPAPRPKTELSGTPIPSDAEGRSTSEGAVERRNAEAPVVTLGRNGKAARLFLDRGQNGQEEIGVEYHVVPLESLIASRKRGYLQPRDEAINAASAVQVNRIADNLNFDQVSEASNAQNGAPIATPGGEVWGGNGRAIAIRTAYENGKAGAYKAALERWAAENGVDIAGIENPVLVRVVSDKGRLSWRDLATASNAAQGNVQTSSESAFADARTLRETKGLVPPFERGGNVSLSSFITPEWAQKFARAIGYNGEVVANGQITPDFMKRIQRSLLVSMLNDRGGNEGMWRTIQGLVESDGEGVKSAVNALVDTAPGLLQISGNANYRNVDILPQVAESLLILEQLHNEGIPVADWKRESRMFNEGEGVKDYRETDGIVRTLVEWFGGMERKNANGVVTGNTATSKADNLLFLRSYIDSLPDMNTGNLFGGTEGVSDRGKLEVLRDAFAKVRESWDATKSKEWAESHGKWLDSITGSDLSQGTLFERNEAAGNGSRLFPNGVTPAARQLQQDILGALSASDSRMRVTVGGEAETPAVRADKAREGRNLGGAYDANGRELYLSEDARPSTPGHEIFHALKDIASRANPAVSRNLTELSERAPKAVKDAIDAIIRERYKDLPPEAFAEERAAFMVGLLSDARARRYVESLSPSAWFRDVNLAARNVLRGANEAVARYFAAKGLSAYTGPASVTARDLLRDRYATLEDLANAVWDAIEQGGEIRIARDAYADMPYRELQEAARRRGMDPNKNAFALRRELADADFAESGRVQGQGEAQVRYERGEDVPSKEELDEAERQRRAVEEFHRDSEGKRRSGFGLAPNGRESALGNEEWTKVRTANFKGFAGDWEAIAAAKAIMGDKEIKSDGKLLKMDPAAQRIEARRLYKIIKENSQKNPIFTQDGRKIQFGGVGLRELKHHSADPHTLALVGVLPDIIRTMRYFGEGDLKKGDAERNIKAYHLYARRVDLGDGPMLARIVIREHKNGDFFYDGDATSIEKIPGPTYRNPNPGSTGDSQNPTHSLAEFFARVNNTSATKVIDENGEPLVVWHGSRWNPLAEPEGYGVFRQGMGVDVGIHFGSREQAAAIEETREGGDPSKTIVNPYFLNIRNPITIKDQGMNGPLNRDFLKAIGMTNEEASRFLSDTTPKITERALEFIKRDYGLNPRAFRNNGELIDAINEIRYQRGQRPVDSSIIGTYRQEAGNSFVVDYLRAKGYDGIIYENAYEGNGKSYAVFDPSQIKSATENVGTFSSRKDVRHEILSNEDLDRLRDQIVSAFAEIRQTEDGRFQPRFLSGGQMTKRTFETKEQAQRVAARRIARAELRDESDKQAFTKNLNILLGDLTLVRKRNGEVDEERTLQRIAARGEHIRGIIDSQRSIAEKTQEGLAALKDLGITAPDLVDRFRARMQRLQADSDFASAETVAGGVRDAMLDAIKSEAAKRKRKAIKRFLDFKPTPGEENISKAGMQALPQEYREMVGWDAEKVAQETKAVQDRLDGIDFGGDAKTEAELSGDFDALKVRARRIALLGGLMHLEDGKYEPRSYEDLRDALSMLQAIAKGERDAWERQDAARRASDDEIRQKVQDQVTLGETASQEGGRAVRDASGGWLRRSFNSLRSFINSGATLMDLLDRRGAEDGKTAPLSGAAQTVYERVADAGMDYAANNTADAEAIARIMADSVPGGETDARGLPTTKTIAEFHRRYGVPPKEKSVGVYRVRQTDVPVLDEYDLPAFNAQGRPKVKKGYVVERVGDANRPLTDLLSVWLHMREASILAGQDFTNTPKNDGNHDVSLMRQLVQQGYTQELFQDLEKALPAELKRAGLRLVDYIGRVGTPIAKETYYREYGRELVTHEGYFPSAREYFSNSKNGFDNRSVVSALRSFMKPRTSNTWDFSPQNAFETALRHMQSVRQVQAYTDSIDLMRHTILDPRVQQAIDYHLPGVNERVKNWALRIAHGGISGMNDSLIWKARRLMTTANVLTTSVMMKQLMSAPMMLSHPPAGVTKREILARTLALMVSDPFGVKIRREWRNGENKFPYYDFRKQGRISFDLALALGNDPMKRATRSRFSPANIMAKVVEFGDSGAFTHVGEATRQLMMEREIREFQRKENRLPNAEERRIILKKCNDFVRRQIVLSQQSGAIEDVSDAQAGPVSGLLYNFSTAPMAVGRYFENNVRNILNGVDRKESAFALATIWLSQMLYQAARDGFAVGDDEDKSRQRKVNQVKTFLTTPIVAAIPVVSTLDYYADRAMGNAQRGGWANNTMAWTDTFETFADVFGDIYKVFSAADKASLDWEQIVGDVLGAGGQITGQPVKGMWKNATGLWHAATDEGLTPGQRALLPITSRATVGAPKKKSTNAKGR